MIKTVLHCRDFSPSRNITEQHSNYDLQFLLTYLLCDILARIILFYVSYIIVVIRTAASTILGCYY